jgi:hypothetical protein
MLDILPRPLHAGNPSPRHFPPHFAIDFIDLPRRGDTLAWTGMEPSMRNRILAAAVILLASCAWGAEPATTQPDFTGDPVAIAAATRYEAAVKHARADYDRIVAAAQKRLDAASAAASGNDAAAKLAQADYDRTVAAAQKRMDSSLGLPRREYIRALKKELAEQTKKGNAVLASEIKTTVEQLEAEEKPEGGQATANTETDAAPAQPKYYLWNWQWPSGTTRKWLCADGRVYEKAGAGPGSFSGKWTQDGKKITLTFSAGFTETIVISADGKTMQGTSNMGGVPFWLMGTLIGTDLDGAEPPGR